VTREERVERQVSRMVATLQGERLAHSVFKAYAMVAYTGLMGDVTVPIAQTRKLREALRPWFVVDAVDGVLNMEH
jgi:hypothetical protein